MQVLCTPNAAVAATAAILLCLLTGTGAVAQDERAFLFIGDMPYTDDQATRLQDVIAPRIRASGFPFLVHYGDYKAGGAACGNGAAVREVHRQIADLIAKDDDPGARRPVFYTPGDNEWTDCDRRFRAGESRSELAQLDLLRRVFFDTPPVAPAGPWRYARQALYPENAVWRSAQVQFATVHLVGTNNGRVGILMDDVALALAHVTARDQANRDWLNRVFAEATDFRDPAVAVIVATQADVTNPDEDAACTPANPMYCDAFARFRAQLIKHAAAFGKPVLLVHGDTGPYCLDRDFGSPRAPNLWRLNAGGDYHQPLDATVVTFSGDDAVAPFSARGLVDGEAPADGC